MPMRRIHIGKTLHFSLFFRGRNSLSRYAATMCALGTAYAVYIGMNANDNTRESAMGSQITKEEIRAFRAQKEAEKIAKETKDRQLAILTGLGNGEIRRGDLMSVQDTNL